MGYDGDEIGYGGPPDGYTADEDVLSSALENHWDKIREAVEETQNSDWLKESAACLDLLSIISRKDFTHLLGGLKKHLRKGRNDGDELTGEQVFGIASDVAAFIEKLPCPLPATYFMDHLSSGKETLWQQPTPSRGLLIAANRCKLEDDFAWARELLGITRAFREILSALSDPDSHAAHLRIRTQAPIQTLNSFLTRKPGQLLVQWTLDGKRYSFGRSPDPENPDLSGYISEWIADYLRNHYPRLGIGVCAECGTFFERERRDKTFCSKTCQNRVAYKRKKILESDSLQRINIAADDAIDIESGLWMHHPRFGIGLIEKVSSANTPIKGLFPPDKQNPRYRSMLSRMVTVQVRFPQGVRTLTFTDLFESQKKEDQLPDFYRVVSEEALAELL